jgi:hypothetical protein
MEGPLRWNQRKEYDKRPDLGYSVAGSIMMKRKPSEALALEAELLRLNELVRDRREQLARLQDCPNKTCECRRVWSKEVGKNLATQVRKIRRELGPQSAKTSNNSATSKRRRAPTSLRKA